MNDGWVISIYEVEDARTHLLSCPAVIEVCFVCMSLREINKGASRKKGALPSTMRRFSPVRSIPLFCVTWTRTSQHVHTHRRELQLLYDAAEGRLVKLFRNGEKWRCVTMQMDTKSLWPFFSTTKQPSSPVGRQLLHLSSRVVSKGWNKSWRLSKVSWDVGWNIQLWSRLHTLTFASLCPHRWYGTSTMDLNVQPLHIHTPKMCAICQWMPVILE